MVRVAAEDEEAVIGAPLGSTVMVVVTSTVVQVAEVTVLVTMTRLISGTAAVMEAKREQAATMLEDFILRMSGLFSSKRWSVSAVEAVKARTLVDLGRLAKDWKCSAID